MPTLNVPARQPACGLGEAGRGRAVWTGSKKKNHKFEGTLVQFTLEKKANLLYIRLLATGSTTLEGRHFMKEEYIFYTETVLECPLNKQFSLCPPLPAPMGFRDSLPCPSLQ